MILRKSLNPKGSANASQSVSGVHTQHVRTPPADTGDSLESEPRPCTNVYLGPRNIIASIATKSSQGPRELPSQSPAHASPEEHVREQPVVELGSWPRKPAAGTSSRL